MCVWCIKAQQCGGNLCRPCWKRLYANKRKIVKK